MQTVNPNRSRGVGVLERERVLSAGTCTGFGSFTVVASLSSLVCSSPEGRTLSTAWVRGWVTPSAAVGATEAVRHSALSPTRW